MAAGCYNGAGLPEDIPVCKVIPSVQQINYQEMEMVGFVHFSMNTFTDREWGFGDEDPGIFNPEQLDCEQWVMAAKEGGLRELILTAKHHDGFCLWPSVFTKHSVKYSPYRNGKGDIVREFTEACRKHGLKTGLYLSPWDRNHPDYGKPEYLTYYRNQLKELLTNYGKIDEIWFDGANGGSGYYGGTNETRTIDNKTYYEWDSTFTLVKSLQPDIMIFSDAGPDLRWVGNENGFAGETFWSMIDDSRLTIGGADQAYLNTGDPDGNKWITGQCDVSIRPGWFYHEQQDSLVKSSQQLVDIYYKSVGRNAVLLLNIPPDRRGLIHENDIDSLKEFRKIIQETFDTNLAVNGYVIANNIRNNDEYFSPANIIDDDRNSYWAADDSLFSAELTIEFKEPVKFDRIVIQEPIRFGQRISRFRVFALSPDNEWILITEGTTIGYKRILKTNPVITEKIRFCILESLNVPSISNFALYLSPDKFANHICSGHF